jgi:hypothetical protein
MRESKSGACCICGTKGKLSFEHLPPQKAFNDNWILLARIEKLRECGSPDGYEDGARKQQKGSGKYTLCEQCNSRTGGWYGSSYVDFAKQGMEFLTISRSVKEFFVPFRINPLHVIKQVMCMFMSVNGSSFQRIQTELVRFILNRETRHLPRHLKLFAFYSIGDRSRHSGVSGVTQGLGTSSYRGFILSEFTFPPFGFVLTFETPSPDARLTDITYFAEYDWNEKRTLWLRMPVLPIYTFYPADYRSRDQVTREAYESARDLR